MVWYRTPSLMVTVAAQAKPLNRRPDTTPRASVIVDVTVRPFDKYYLLAITLPAGD
jgi:hypothetical protein